ncbi:unnamed protein product [Allacma fusca]|uniref:Ketoreductase domain-containing protein n=1 Tax=Allacma fusca TaxID=39272 RepID=A0A8J2JSX1_9HEXA|nr:unnamed protein product [Allacma fusca]
MSFNPEITGKVALITGASSGIGRYTAVEFAKSGCRLALTGRNKAALEETATLCKAEGVTSDNILVVVADLENVEDCRRIVAETVGQFQQLDFLVNNAGVLVVGSVKELPLEEYEHQMNVNVRSVFVTTQAAVPHLQKTKGNIVNVSSLAGLRALPGKVAYCMSKAALDQFTQTVALELAGDGIRVNSVNPGVILTNCHRNSGMDEETYQKYLAHSKIMHPLGRVGSPEEVGQAIVFLSSDKLSGFMTGVLLPIDGGRSVTCPR